MTDDASYTSRAADAVNDAINADGDIPGWLAAVLAHAAARCGSTSALTARRPGSWEAELITRLVCGTVGWDDEDLHLYRPPRPDPPVDS